MPHPVHSPAQKQVNFRIRSACIQPLERRCLLSATVFAAPVPYNIGASSSSAANNVSADGVTTADFDRDGKPDLAVVHTADGTVNILLNKGNGSFKPAVSYATGLSGPIWVTAADLNGDKKLDLAILGQGAVSILLGNGDGTFASAKTYAAGPVCRGGVAVADFNGDGHPDLAVAQFGAISSTQSAVDIFINNGNGTFKPFYTVGVWPAARSVIAGDFNRDGKADLAVADGLGINNQLDPKYPAGVTILLGNGKGSFKTAAQINAVPTPDAGSDGKGTGDTVNPENIFAVDLNGDGKLDLIETLYDHNIDVFLGNGDGSFKSGVGYNTGEYPRAVSAVDVNGDGRLDLVVANVGANNGDKGQTEDGSIAVLLGTGGGTFAAPIEYTPIAFPGWLTTGDFNGDGLPDVAATRVADGHSVDILFDQKVTVTHVPVVSGMKPASGSTAGGDEITITGTNFTGATLVKFGGVSAKAITVNSATSITAISPAHVAGTVDVVVIGPAGASAVAADRFTFLGPIALPAPIALSPGTSQSPGPVINTLTPTLTWQPISGVAFTGYQINLYDTTSGQSSVYHVGVSVHSFTIPSSAVLNPGSHYTWSVRAVNGSQSGTPSYLSFQTPTLPQPVILGVGGTSQPGPLITTLTPTLSWQPITDIAFDSYQINLYDITAKKFLSIQVKPTATSYVIPAGTLTSGDSYVWNLRLKIGNITGPESTTYLYFRVDSK